MFSLTDAKAKALVLLNFSIVFTMLGLFVSQSEISSFKTARSPLSVLLLVFIGKVNIQLQCKVVQVPIISTGMCDASSFNIKSNKRRARL